MRKILSFFLFFLGVASLSLAQMEFRISPPTIDIDVGRGGVKVFSFELSNENREKTLRFRIFPLDLEADRSGAPKFLEIGKSKYSCSKWIELEPKEILLEPGKNKKIIGKLSVPATASAGGYYSAIVCELVPERPTKTEAGAIIKWRIASLIKVSVLGGRIERKAELEDFSLRTLFEEEERKKGITFVASLKNQGNIHLKAEGRLTILTPDRRRKGEVDFDVGSGTVLPEHIRDFVCVYDKFLPEGEYIARATFRYGGRTTLVKEIPFSIAVERPLEKEEETVVVPSLKLIPEEISLKIPAGGFRTAGFTIQNQRADSLRIQVSLDKKGEIQDWFKIEPQEVKIEGGREKKILLKINLPPEVREGKYKSKINLQSFLITDRGEEESLEPVNIGVTIEIPKF